MQRFSWIENCLSSFPGWLSSSVLCESHTTAEPCECVDSNYSSEKNFSIALHFLYTTHHIIKLFHSPPPWAKQPQPHHSFLKGVTPWSFCSHFSAPFPVLGFAHFPQTCLLKRGTWAEPSRHLCPLWSTTIHLFAPKPFVGCSCSSWPGSTSLFQETGFMRLRRCLIKYLQSVALEGRCWPPPPTLAAVRNLGGTRRNVNWAFFHSPSCINRQGPVKFLSFFFLLTLRTPSYGVFFQKSDSEQGDLYNLTTIYTKSKVLVGLTSRRICTFSPLLLHNLQTTTMNVTQWSCLVAHQGRHPRFAAGQQRGKQRGC